MSKIFKPLILLIRFIYRIIDKLIVTPISRIIYKVDTLLKDNSGNVEKILNRPNVLVYVSLFLAIAVFLLVDTQVINLSEREAEVIYDQPVTVKYNDEAYVVEGVPEDVDITLIGSKSSIYLATQLGNHEVTLDLSNYGVGTYKVKLKYNHSVTSVDYKLDPSVITVKISEKVSYPKSLQYELLNTDKLDSKLSVSAVSLDCNNIIVKSSQEIIDKIGVVKALIDASQITLTDSGDYTLENVKLVAYDQEGAILENVEMVPSKVNATVTVDSYHATKPVKIVTTGSFSNGYAISSIESSVKEVVVYGEKSVVDALTNVEATVDLSSFDSNKENTIETTLDLNKPTGVREMSATKTKVKIKVESSVDKQVDGVSIHTIGLGNGYTVNAVSDGDKAISVIVKGVSSVVKEYDSSKVYAYVDLTGLKPGTHTLPVFITVEDERVTIKPLVDKISVKIK